MAITTIHACTMCIFLVVQKRPFHIMKKNSFLWELLCYSFAMILFFHVFVLKIVLQFLCPLWHLSVGNASLKCLTQINDGDGFAESDTWQQCREREKNVVAWIKPGHQVISATAKWWYINLTTNSIVIHFISNATFFFYFFRYFATFFIHTLQWSVECVIGMHVSNFENLIAKV